MQIIASAGSGKTEVVSQRVVDLLADGVPADAIIAFTFTEKAASELKARIQRRVEERLGTPALDRLTNLSVGTIHAFCFRFLQQRIPRYESYDVLDDNQLTAFLAREASRLNIKQLDPGNRLFASIKAFLKSVDVVENELLAPDTITGLFGEVLRAYYETLERYRLLTYGQQVARAVGELERPEIAAKVHERLRHLIVDEYQDVNPAQEKLIRLLAGPGVELCVVGDDQQAVYQWRGSDVRNIVRFAENYQGVTPFEINVNRRSRPGVVEIANRFAESIVQRIDKTMLSDRVSGEPPHPEVVIWSADTEQDEAGMIASLILDINERGIPYRDIAVLVRSRAAYRQLLEQFATFDIPVQPGGRTGLFEQPEARLMGQTFAWLSDTDWRDRHQQGAKVKDDSLISDYTRIFALEPNRVRALTKLLREWKAAVPRTSRTADLVGELYELLDVLAVKDWNLSSPVQVNRLGTLARFSSLLADYESVRRRARPDADAPGEQVGGQDRGSWYYTNLAVHIINYAQGTYEGFDGEADFDLDAVELTTIHGAKGLEWPAVFVPSLTKGRFPSRYTGEPQDWLLPRELFDAARYEGSDEDERRLLYVAITRARDWLSLSRHERVTKNRVAQSPYHAELEQHLTSVDPAHIKLPAIHPRGEGDDDPIMLSFSELSAFLDCGLAFRLRDRIGFEPRLATELGYGKAVHHVLRTLAEATRESGTVPDETARQKILDESFFLPTANKAAHRQLKRAAKELVNRYATEYADDLYRVWETEHPFELHLDGVTISGRADVILDQEGGITNSLAILDYKTSTTGEPAEHALQLQVYADAGRREGLNVNGAYVHDLKAKARETIDVSVEAVQAAGALVAEVAGRIRARDYTPSPGRHCRRCEVRTICNHAKR